MIEFWNTLHWHSEKHCQMFSVSLELAPMIGCVQDFHHHLKFKSCWSALNYKKELNGIITKSLTKIFAIQFIKQKLGCRNKFHVTPISGLFNPYRYEIINYILQIYNLWLSHGEWELFNRERFGMAFIAHLSSLTSIIGVTTLTLYWPCCCVSIGWNLYV